MKNRSRQYDPEQSFTIPKYVLDDDDIKRLITSAQQLILESFVDDDNTELASLIVTLGEELDHRRDIRIPIEAAEAFGERLRRDRRRRKPN